MSSQNSLNRPLRPRESRRVHNHENMETVFQDIDMREEDLILGEDRIKEERLEAEVRVLKEEEHAKDIKWFQNPSDVALQSAEHEENLWLHGFIDLQYYFNMTRDPNSLSTGRSTVSSYAASSPSIPSPTTPSEYPCLYPNCGHISSGAYDLQCHWTVHFPPVIEKLLGCKYKWCGRTGLYGFNIEDHRKEHYRKVHMEGSEYLKTGKGGRELWSRSEGTAVE